MAPRVLLGAEEMTASDADNGQMKRVHRIHDLLFAVD
jgi:hypothetical protein